MRLPVVPPISTKDGLSNKNARLTNCLKEVKKGGEKAVVRPGLVLDAVASGVGHGLVAFNNELISVYGATLGLNTEAAAGSVVSVITSTIDSFTETQASKFTGGTQWLIGGLNTDIEEGELYTYDSSTDFTTLLATGMPLGDIMGIAASGTSVVVVTFAQSFGGGSQSVCVADIATLTFTDKSTAFDSPFNVKYADGKFVVIHDSSRVSWSVDDGATWSANTSTPSKGRDLLFDGTAWWFFGSDGISPSDIWAYKTTDFVTFSAQTISGLPSAVGVRNCAYNNGRYYLLSDYLYSSTDGLSWTLLSSEITLNLGFVMEASDGNVYTRKPTPDTLYRIDGTTLTEIANTPFAGEYTNVDSNDEGLIIIGSTFDASVVRVDVSSGVDAIPALATITGDYYDFAQSPI